MTASVDQDSVQSAPVHLEHKSHEAAHQERDDVVDAEVSVSALDDSPAEPLDHDDYQEPEYKESQGFEKSLNAEPAQSQTEQGLDQNDSTSSSKVEEAQKTAEDTAPARANPVNSITEEESKNEFNQPSQNSDLNMSNHINTPDVKSVETPAETATDNVTAKSIETVSKPSSKTDTEYATKLVPEITNATSSDSKKAQKTSKAGSQPTSLPNSPSPAPLRVSTPNSSKSATSSSGGVQWASYLKRAVANVEQTLDKVIQETSSSEVNLPDRPVKADVVASQPSAADIKIHAPQPVKASPRTGGRLTMQERLAMALGGRNSPSSPTTSTNSTSPFSETPISSPKASLDTKRPSFDKEESNVTQSKEVETAEISVEKPAEINPTDKLEPARSLLAAIPDESVRTQLENIMLDLATNPKLEDQSAELHHAQEKINSLESKLKFLAREEAQHAKALKSSSSGIERKLAEKEEQVALLLEEGQILSRNELKHMNTIKALRAKERDNDRILQSAQKRQETAERDALRAKEALRSMQDTEKRLNEANKARSKLENENETLKKDKQMNLVRLLLILAHGIY